MKIRPEHVAAWETPPDLEWDRAPSPLIYPGGKSRAIPFILPLLLEGMTTADTSELVAPFFGGGSLELVCAQQGATVFGSDIFEPLTCFWHYALTAPDALADAVEKYYAADFDCDGFKALQKLIPQMPAGLEKAAAFFVANRLSHYGLTLIGSKASLGRFTENSIEKLRSFSAPGVSVEHLDYRQALLKRQSAFAYLDPVYDFPETRRNRLYGVNGDTHRGFNHEALFEAIRDRPNWIMSYNADENVLQRYADFPRAFPMWSYGMAKVSKSNEVLLFAKNLADLAAKANARFATGKAANDHGNSSAEDRAPVEKAPSTVTVSTVAARPWEPADLSVCSENATPAPTFPRKVLGAKWQAWSETVAAGANAHFDYVAMTLIGTAAGLVGNALTVRAHAGFVQPSVLWVCNVGKSGAGKTPAMAVISDIVDDLEQRGRQRLRDASVAAAVKLAAETPKGLLHHRDEISGSWNVMKRTGGEDFYLESWNGKPFTKDRKTDEPIFIEHLSMSMVGGAQPETIKDIATDRKNRGFAPRWLFAYPDPVEGYAGDGDQIDTAWATEALGLLKALPVGGPSIPLSPEGQVIFRGWWDAKRREAAEHDGIWAEWLAKQGGNALRLSLALEMLKWCSRGAAQPRAAALPAKISTGTLKDTLRLIDDWARPMAQRTLAVMYRSPKDRHVSALARHLRRAKLTTFNARLLRRGAYGVAGALDNAEAMDGACRALVDANLIRHVGVRNHVHRGRAPQDYEVNPVLFASEAPTASGL